jgi:FkbM family methyltransferase
MTLFAKLNALITLNLKKVGIEEMSSHFIYFPSCFNSTFIDLGANQGVFYQAFQPKFQAKGYAVEASPALFKILPPNKHVQCYNYAVTDQNKTIDFYISANCEANSINANVSEQWGLQEKVSVEGINLDEFIKKAAIVMPIGLVKIDIEGAEIQVLSSVSDELLHNVGQIAVEFHDFLIRDKDYHLQMHQILSRLEKLNFEIVKVSINDYREVLCINKSLINLSLNSKLRLKFLHPFLKLVKKLHTQLHYLIKK